MVGASRRYPRHLLLLVGKHSHEIFVLTFKCSVLRLNGGLLLLEGADYQLQLFDLLPFFLARAHGRLPVLQALAGFLVSLGVVLVAENPISISYLLLEVLELLLG